MTLRTFEILVPARREQFEQFLLDNFNGFTNAGERWGQWKDAKGTVHKDGTVAYQVSAPLPFVDFAGLVRVPVSMILASKARECWPKEQAWYVAQIGTAEILWGHGKPQDGSESFA